MGLNTFKSLVTGKNVQKTVVEASFEGMTTFENYYYHTQGSLFPTYGNAVEISIKLPPGNYEIEAIVRLFNNNVAKKHYGCFLYFFLDDSSRNVWEGGEIGQSIHTTPHVVNLKVMSTFKKSKEIRLQIGCNADKAFIAENASLMIKRIGMISYKSK